MYLHAVVPHRPLQDGLERLSDAAVLKNNRALEDILTAATEEAVSESIKGMGSTPKGRGAHQGGGVHTKGRGAHQGGGVHTKGAGWCACCCCCCSY